MANTLVPSLPTPSRSTYSCVRCADRKVKCNRQQPCSTCLKHGVECVFRPLQLNRKRRKRVSVRVLTDRLKQYEALLRDRGFDMDRITDTFVGNKTPENTERRHAQTSQLLEPEDSEDCNQSKAFPQDSHLTFVENSLWSRVVDEAQLSDTATEEPSGSIDLDASGDDMGFVFDIQEHVKISPFHPSPDHILRLWDIFVDNIDPLTKIVHVPTLRLAIQKAATNIKSIPRNFEALLFAIYSTAIMSMDDTKCLQHFGASRKPLLLQYTSATQVALSRAKFMGTTSLVVLQALLLHLLSVRDSYEPRTVWTLTGVAVRIAQSMGLERDGERLGLPPFETEIRRRIWWQLKLHDFRTAELCGLAKFRDLDLGVESTKWPTNINDDILAPGLTTLETGGIGMTDAAFVIFRCEFANFAAGRIAAFRQRGMSSSQWNLDTMQSADIDMDSIILELEETLETKYMRYCDPSQSLHLLTMVAARYGLNVIRFLTHHPRGWTEHTLPSERELVLNISIKLLEQHNMLLTNSLLKPFAWHSTYFRQWHAFIHILDVLRAEPTMPSADKIWQLVATVYEMSPGMILDMRKPIHQAISRLCLKAYSAREAVAQQQNHEPRPPTPGFIMELRQRSNAVNSERKAHDDRMHRQTIFASRGNGDAAVEAMGPQAGPKVGEITFMGDHMGQGINSIRKNEDDGCELFDLFDSLESGRTISSTLDPEFLLLFERNPAADTMETIDWAQWDALLTDSSIMGSKIS